MLSRRRSKAKANRSTQRRWQTDTEPESIVVKLKVDKSSINSDYETKETPSTYVPLTSPAFELPDQGGISESDVDEWETLQISKGAQGINHALVDSDIVVETSRTTDFSDAWTMRDSRIELSKSAELIGCKIRLGVERSKTLHDTILQLEGSLGSCRVSSVDHVQKQKYFSHLQGEMECLLLCLADKVDLLTQAERELQSMRIARSSKHDLYLSEQLGASIGSFVSVSQFQHSKTISFFDPTLEREHFKAMLTFRNDVSVIFRNTPKKWASIDALLNMFLSWRTSYPTEYSSAWGTLSLQALVSVYVRFDLLLWSPLDEPTIESLPCFNPLTRFSLLCSDTLVVETICRKHIFPELVLIVESHWNILSWDQTMQLIALLDSVSSSLPASLSDSLFASLEVSVSRMFSSIILRTLECRKVIDDPTPHSISYKGAWRFSVQYLLCISLLSSKHPKLVKPDLVNQLYSAFLNLILPFVARFPEDSKSFMGYLGHKELIFDFIVTNFPNGVSLIAGTCFEIDAS